jgi:hypothetical protein
MAPSTAKAVAVLLLCGVGSADAVSVFSPKPEPIPLSKEPSRGWAAKNAPKSKSELDKVRIFTIFAMRECARARASLLFMPRSVLHKAHADGFLFVCLAHLRSWTDLGKMLLEMGKLRRKKDSSAGDWIAARASRTGLYSQWGG